MLKVFWKSTHASLEAAQPWSLPPNTETAEIEAA